MEMNFIGLRMNKYDLYYEASVGGGIPIIMPMRELAANNILSMTGILNGTTNYVDRMDKDGMSYNDVLTEAQELGFAEQIRPPMWTVWMR